jgi:uncharacterized membrane protein YfcA
MESLSTLQLAYCALVLVLAYGLRGSTGFGGAAGMPLLALVVPIKLLVPLWTLLGFASSVTILGRDRRKVAVRDFVAFVPWCVIGIGIGLYFFAALDARTLARGLGLLILLYAAYAWWGTTRATPRKTPRGLGPLASALSGVVGTIFGTMGTVFFAMYLDSRTLPKEAFRATMSAMLLTLSAVRGIGYYAVGEFTAEVWVAFAAAFPLMLLGIYLGDRIHVRLSELAFRRLVCVILVICGVPLLFK